MSNKNKKYKNHKQAGLQIRIKRPGEIIRKLKKLNNFKFIIFDKKALILNKIFSLYFTIK